MAETEQSLLPEAERIATPQARVNNEAARQYWEAVSADDNGMLGGFPFVSRADLRGSRSFLAKLGIGSKPGLRQVKRALEGGAGIGRVTQGLLLDVAEEVDVIEPVAKFTEALRAQLGVRRIYSVGLEQWAEGPRKEQRGGQGEGQEGQEKTQETQGETEDTYGLVWTQWCTGYLNNSQLLAYLERCRALLEPGEGVVVIKENVTTTGSDDFDAADSSVTRSEESFRSLFARAGFRLVRSELQRGFPPEAELLPVKMYALKPK